MQAQAVRNILQASSGNQPYVVFGPPGTGKTTTIVEAVCHVVRASASARVLCCAPSNNAADEFILRLRDTVPPSQMFRLNAPSRSKDALKEELQGENPRRFLEYCCCEADAFEVPELAKLRSFRVVVSTCCSAALIRAAGVPEGHFTHVFVDEAGHALEPELLIPLMAAKGARPGGAVGGPEAAGARGAVRVCQEDGASALRVPFAWLKVLT